MATLTRRTQLLLDEDMHNRLQRLALQEKTSVGALIRKAVVHAYPAVTERRREAARSFLAAESSEVEALDYPELKKLIASTYERLLDEPGLNQSDTKGNSYENEDSD